MHTQSSSYLPNLSAIQDSSSIPVQSVLLITSSKLISLLSILLLPSLLPQQPSSHLLALIVALDIYLTKNSARKFLHINYYIDSNLSTDRWVFEAGLTPPGEVFEAIFGYAFVFYGVFLGCMLVLNLGMMRFSIAVAVLIGFVGNFVAAFVYWKVGKMRRRGVLNKVVMERSQNQDEMGVYKSVKLVPKGRSMLAVSLYQ